MTRTDQSFEIHTTDHDLARDVAHAAGLAITEATGNGTPVLTHAPSTRVERRGTDGRICVVTDLYLPSADAWADRLEILNAAVSEVVIGVDPLYRGGFVSCRDKGNRQILERAALIIAAAVAALATAGTMASAEEVCPPELAETASWCAGPSEADAPPTSADPIDDVPVIIDPVIIDDLDGAGPDPDTEEALAAERAAQIADAEDRWARDLEDGDLTVEEADAIDAARRAAEEDGVEIGEAVTIEREEAVSSVAYPDGELPRTGAPLPLLAGAGAALAALGAALVRRPAASAHRLACSARYGCAHGPDRRCPTIRAERAARR